MKVRYYDIECIQNNHKETFKIEHEKINGRTYNDYLHDPFLKVITEIIDKNKYAINTLRFDIQANGSPNHRWSYYVAGHYLDILKKECPHIELNIKDCEKK